MCSTCSTGSGASSRCTPRSAPRTTRSRRGERWCEVRAGSSATTRSHRHPGYGSSRTSRTTRRCGSSPRSCRPNRSIERSARAATEPVWVHALRGRALREAASSGCTGSTAYGGGALPPVPRRDRRQRDVRRGPLPARHGQGCRPRHGRRRAGARLQLRPTTPRARTTRNGRARSRRRRTGSTCRMRAGEPALDARRRVGAKTANAGFLRPSAVISPDCQLSGRGCP